MGKPLNIKALVGGEPVQLVLAKTLLSKCDQYGIFTAYGNYSMFCTTKFRIMIIQLLLEDQSLIHKIYLLNKATGIV
jgi:hypothetical protein